MVLNRNIILLLSSIFLFFLLFFLLNDVDWQLRVAFSLMIASVILWIFEPIPLSQTAVILLLLFIILDVSTTEVILSGFSSNAMFLVLAGLMLGQGVNQTELGKRIALWFLSIFAGKRGGLLFGVVMIQQVFSVFIPAPVIRTAILIPILQSIIDNLDNSTQLEKQLMMGLAYGGNISAIGFMPAAIVNVITVEMINSFTGVQVTFLNWFLLMLPVWMLMIPITWLVIYVMFPVADSASQQVIHSLKLERSKITGMDRNEIKVISIFSLTVLLWVTESLHHIHPAFSALLGTTLLAMPAIGVTSWNKITNINMEIILIVGATLSIGNALNDSGVARYIVSMLETPLVLDTFSNGYISIFLIILITQIYHLLIANVGTAAVTLLPVVMVFSETIGLNPIMVAFLTSITLSFGFVLVVETLPNILVQSTGLVSQRDFFKSGIILTVASMLVSYAVVFTWWKLTDIFSIFA